MTIGNIDHADRSSVLGWAQDENGATTPVTLLIEINGRRFARVVANLFREDLSDAGIGAGYHAFAFHFPSYLCPHSRHVIGIRNEDDSSHVPGSPIVLDPHRGTDQSTRGNIDRLDIDRLEGWAQDIEDPDRTVSLLVTDNGAFVARILADRHRADLEQAGIGDGRHAFAFEFIPPLAETISHDIHVTRETDGQHIIGSPMTIEPIASFGSSAEAGLKALLGRYQAADDVEKLAHCLADQLHGLVQRHARAMAPTAEPHRYVQLAQRWTNSATSGNRDHDAPQRRVLVVDDRIPRIDEDAGSVAIVSHMRAMQRLGYRIAVVASAEFAPPTEFASRLEALDIEVFRPPFYNSVEDVFRTNIGKFDTIYLHRASNASQYGELARRYFPNARRIYATADLHFIRIGRQAVVQDRPELHGLSRRLRMLELVAASTATTVITHSSFEADILRKRLPAKDIHIIPWSVPAAPSRRPAAERSGIAFIGNYQHAPNIDAVRWLIAEILPALRLRDAGIECHLVGSGLPDEVAGLCPPGVHVLGHVESLGAIFDRVRLTVAPLRFGAGIKGKLIDSLAAGIPCIHTSIAAEGMPLPDALSTCRADDAAAFAARIFETYHDLDACASLAKVGLDFVEREFSEEKLDRQFGALLK